MGIGMQFPQAVTCGQATESAALHHGSIRLVEKSARRVRISACGLLLFSQGEREGGVFRAEVDAMARCLFRLLPCHDQQQFLAFPLYADSVDFGHVCQGAQGRPDVQHGGELDEAESRLAADSFLEDG